MQQDKEAIYREEARDVRQGIDAERRAEGPCSEDDEGPYSEDSPEIRRESITPTKKGVIIQTVGGVQMKFSTDFPGHVRVGKYGEYGTPVPYMVLEGTVWIGEKGYAGSADTLSWIRFVARRANER